MNILLAYSDKSDNKKVLAAAKAQAAAFNATVTVMTSLLVPDPIKKNVALENLKKAEEFFRNEGIDCRIELSVTGLSIGEDVVKYARENDVDQIIFGVRSRSKVGKLLFGSDAQHVILDSPCTVLCVKP